MRLIEAYISAVIAGLNTLDRADQVASHVCFYRKTRAVVLDNLLGPAEDFEYVRPT